MALQLGALGVVLETVASGITELPLKTFALLMQPVHLAIGIVEGLVTAAVVSFVWKAQPEILAQAAERHALAHGSRKKILAGLGAAALVVGVALSWFASAYPDGLEWSIAGVTGSEEIEGEGAAIHQALAGIQEKTAFLPDYAFKAAMEESVEKREERPAWPAVDAATSVSGIVGGLLTLLIAIGVGWALRRRQKA
ncbi:MAG: cobalt transport protein CbiN [candidate division BRC1 bacterium ADurb.BinA364]|nr:MAG: cobalt transport protein CbiN [candidate division BRC1 bacterium ADurb.BinA364]